MLQMASVFRGSGFDNLGGPMGGQTQPSFPAPGNPNAPQSANSPTTPAAPGTTPAAGGTAPLPMYGQFGDPSALMQLLGGVGGAGFGAGAGATAPPAGPPPEERFQVQLQVRRLMLLGCWPGFGSRASGSNYKIWGSPTPLKTCVHFLRQAGMCMPQ